MEKEIELLSKDRLLPLVQNRIAEFEELVLKLSASLSDAPSGFLSISPHQGSYQYFLVAENARRTETYIPREKIETARKLAQRDYNRRMLSEMLVQLNALKKFEKKYVAQKLEGYFETLHTARRSLVTPLLLPNEDFAALWQSVPYEGRPFEDDACDLRTANGERVRSKSEIIIADTLFRLGIPYRYEYPHLFLKTEDVMQKEKSKRKNLRTRSIRIFPDFTCLNVRTRGEYIWEHFGLVDSPSYAENVNEKLCMYAANDFYYGQNLIMTQETKDKPLSPWMVERLARRFLL